MDPSGERLPASAVVDNLSYFLKDGTEYPRDSRCGCPICPECQQSRNCDSCEGTCVVCVGLVRPGPKSVDEAKIWTPDVEKLDIIDLATKAFSEIEEAAATPERFTPQTAFLFDRLTNLFRRLDDSTPDHQRMTDWLTEERVGIIIGAWNRFSNKSSELSVSIIKEIAVLAPFQRSRFSKVDTCTALFGALSLATNVEDESHRNHARLGCIALFNLGYDAGACKMIAQNGGLNEMTRVIRVFIRAEAVIEEAVDSVRRIITRSSNSDINNLAKSLSMESVLQEVVRYHDENKEITTAAQQILKTFGTDPAKDASAIAQQIISSVTFNETGSNELLTEHFEKFLVIVRSNPKQALISPEIVHTFSSIYERLSVAVSTNPTHKKLFVLLNAVVGMLPYSLADGLPDIAQGTKEFASNICRRLVESLRRHAEAPNIVASILVAFINYSHFETLATMLGVSHCGLEVIVDLMMTYTEDSRVNEELFNALLSLTMNSRTVKDKLLEMNVAEIVTSIVSEATTMQPKARKMAERFLGCLFGD